MPLRRNPTPLIGVSVNAATLMFSLEHDVRLLAVGGAFTLEDNYRHLFNSRMNLTEYISKLEALAGITPETFYRRD